MTAVYNTSAPVDTNYYEGYISIDNLSIMVDARGYLSIGFDLSLAVCFNQPLSIR